MTDRSIEPDLDTPDIVPTRAGYDRWAAVYDTESNPLIALEEPRVDRLLGDVRGLAVLDVGCGTGRHAVRLAGRGARVHAIDFSEEMLERARRKAEAVSLAASAPSPSSASSASSTSFPSSASTASCAPGTTPSIAFHVHDLAQPLPFPTKHFDRVICGLVVDHIPDLAGLFGEMRRVCRADGFVVVSVMHPAMMLRGVQARFRDPDSGRRVMPASCPHQLSDYVMAATRAGFALDLLSEHAVDEELAARMDRARRYLGWPMLFLMRLRPLTSDRRDPRRARRI